MERVHTLDGNAIGANSLRLMAETCNSCGLCMRQCAFLNRHGSPARIARTALENDEYAQAFECSLCGLCDAVCPQDLQVKDMFLQMRRQAVESNPALLKRFKGLRSYVGMGRSRWLQSYALPEGCTQVFFPGCALPGTRANLTWDIYTQLVQQIPDLGLVLDCCAKPYHDIGMQTQFSHHLNDLGSKLEEYGIARVITACPNCYEVFSRYLPQVELTSVYEVLGQDISLESAPDDASGQPLVTVHDPCVNRKHTGVQRAVRNLVQERGLAITEMKNHAETTICCGEGGCVMATAPDLAQSWRRQRVHQSDGLPVVTYCAGCVEYLSTEMPTLHVLDLLKSSPGPIMEPVQPTRGLKRYLDRFNLKRKSEKYMQNQAGMSIEVENAPTTKKKRSIWGRLALLTLLVAAIAALKISGAGAYLQPERMQGWIAGYGYWAPLIYIALYSLAPALFMPGLPLTILGECCSARFGAWCTP